MDAAYRDAYGEAPSVWAWTGWVRNFRHFGLLVGGVVANRNSHRKRKSERLRERYYRSADFDFDAWYALAEARARRLIALGYDYYQAGDFSPASRQEFCRAADIGDLIEPSNDGLPSLPELPPVSGESATRARGTAKGRRKASPAQDHREVAA
jgi:hypothetical protein